MTVKTDYGWLVVSGTARIRVFDLGERLLVGDWSSDSPHDGALCFLEALRNFGTREIVVTLDERNDRLERFYSEMGFRPYRMVKNG